MSPPFRRRDSSPCATQGLKEPENRTPPDGAAVKSWRTLVQSGALIAIVVFVINIATLGVLYSKFEVEDNVSTVWTGDCGHAAGVVAAAHLIINVLSSLLLAASNASMQCLASPTRAEVDAAHAAGRAFAIGVPSFTNIFMVSKSKKYLWFLLALSSLPLHLFWNSTVFQTLATNNYYAMAVTENFTTGGRWEQPQIMGGTWPESWGALASEEMILSELNRTQRLAVNSGLQRLHRSDCIGAYAREMIEGRRNVLLVTNTSDYRPYTFADNSSTLVAVFVSSFAPDARAASSEDPPSYAWMGPSLSNLTSLARNDTAPWQPGRYDSGEEMAWVNCGFENPMCDEKVYADIQYCLSEKVEGRCKVSLIPVFLIIVCGCNAVKIAAFVWTLLLTRKSAVLVTQGDAIRSFLDDPDPTAREMCLAPRSESVFNLFSASRRRVWRGRSAAHAKRPWTAAVSTVRWLIAYTSAVIFLIAVGKLFIRSATTYESRHDLWTMIMSLNIGQPSPSFTMGQGNMSILTAFFAANIPQLVLSYFYVNINALQTRMLGMVEWTSYYNAPVGKGLRVSKPVARSHQTSTYFLTIPLRWGVPSLIIFMVLHWLTSEMVFAAKIDTYSSNGVLNPGDSVIQVYFSPIVTICTISIGAAAMMVLYLLAICNRFPAGASLAGNRSISIAAACQPMPGEDSFEPHLSEKALRWGVVKVPNSETDRIHATFSEASIARIEPDMSYFVVSDGKIGKLMHHEMNQMHASRMDP